MPGDKDRNIAKTPSCATKDLDSTSALDAFRILDAIQRERLRGLLSGDSFAPQDSKIHHWLSLMASCRSGCVISPHSFCRSFCTALLSGSLRNANANQRYAVGRSCGVHNPAE
jgi:hypothetical protein